jgi:diguanylate cyclase (GGDEF)-like protein
MMQVERHRARKQPWLVALTGEGARRAARAALMALPPLLLYAGLLLRAPTGRTFLWFGGTAAALLAYGAYYYISRKRIFLDLCLFLAGLSMAGLAGLSGRAWLHTAYIPFVIGVGVLAPSRSLLVATLSVPLYEALHLAGGNLAEELALLGFAALSSGMVYMMRRKSAAAEAPDEEGAPVPGPEELAGLERGCEPEELGEILRAVMFTIKPGAASLFLIDEGELALKCSTDENLALSDGGIVQEAVRFRQTIMSGGLPGVRQSPGYETTRKVASVAATPVLDRGIVLGVLAVDSTKRGAFDRGSQAGLELFAAQVARVLEKQRIFTETTSNEEWLRVIQEESARLLTSLEPGTIIQNASEAMQKIAPVNMHFFLKSAAGYDLVYQNSPVEQPAASYDLRDTLVEMALTEREIKYFSNLAGYPLPALPFEGEAVTSALMLPLVYRGEPLGVVVFTSEDTDSIKPRQIDCLGVLGNQAAISLKNALFHAEIKHRALTDGLTGLYNHKAFKEKLSAEFKRFSRAGRPFSLLLVDIDFFKKVNDTHGHPAGDDVLRGVAQAISETLRDVDITARYGGEEFAALLMDTDSFGALSMAERLRRHIARTGFRTEGSTLSVTVSIGISSCPEDTQGQEELIEFADRALYRAKAGGRNRSMAWNDIKEA